MMSYCVLNLFACPPDQITAVTEIIENHGLTADVDAGPLWTLRLNHTYSSGDQRDSCADDIAAALQDEAPGAIWEVSDDVEDEYLGDLHRFAPSLGLFKADCDNDGNPMFSVEQVREIVRIAGGQRQVDLDAVEVATGEAWATLFVEMASEMPGSYPVPVPRCTECQDQITGPINAKRLCEYCTRESVALARTTAKELRHTAGHLTDDIAAKALRDRADEIEKEAGL